MLFSVRFFAAISLLLACITAAQAQVQVTDAWVRATVAQQKATGAFMQLQSGQAAKLVAASSPVAAVAELHEMAMEGEVMKMRQVPAIDLPAGAAVKLAPGGWHIMLMQLKQPMQEGQLVPLTLMLEYTDGQRESVEVSATVRPLNSKGSTGAKPMSHEGHHGH